MRTYEKALESKKMEAKDLIWPLEVTFWPLLDFIIETREKQIKNKKGPKMFSRGHMRSLASTFLDSKAFSHVLIGSPLLRIRF